MSTALVLLAAGQGSRMESDLPKVLHKLAGAPLLAHAMRAGQPLEPQRVIVVAGHGADQVRKAALDFDDSVEIVLQSEQLGTSHAVDQARAALADFDGAVIVLYGDTPFIRPETLQAMLDKRAEGNAVVVLGFEAANPGRYGRLIVKDGTLREIVEAKEATPAQLAVTLCNSGVICADRAVLFDLIADVSNKNASGEFYLTDIIGLANKANMRCSTVTCDEAETLGINTRAELAGAEAAFQIRARCEALENGATLTAPDTVWLAYDTLIGRDAVIGPNVVFGPGVTIESGAEIKAFSHLEGCHVSQGAVVGPYARLRPGAEIGDNARIGNFVEIKASFVGEGAKVNHLSYIGDAEIGAAANIGAGAITCNYDGVLKHKTVIGDRAFVGSNTALVAPVSIGRDAMIGSGSVITADVPAEALALARARQINKPGLAAQIMDRLMAIKALKYKG